MAIFVDKNGKPTSSELSTYSEQLFFDKKNNNFYASGKEYRKPYQTIKLPDSGAYDCTNNVCLVKLGVINLNNTDYNGISGTFKFFDSQERASKYSLNGSELYMSFRIATNNKVVDRENVLYWKEFYGDMSDESCVFVAQSASLDNNDPIANSNSGILSFGPDSTTNHSSSFEVWFRCKRKWRSIIIEWWPEYASPGVTFDLITNPVFYTEPIGSSVIEIPYGGNTFTIDEFTNNICSHTSEHVNTTMYNGTFVAFSYYKPSVNAINSLYNKINYSSRDSLYYLTFVDGTSGNRQTYTDSDITVNPSSNTISATNFEGTASKVNIKQNTSANSTYYLMLTNKSAGSTYTYTTTNIKVTPSTNTITASVFDGKATYIQTSVASTSASYYLTFVNNTSGGRAYVMTDLSFNPSTEELKTSHLRLRNGNANSGSYLRFGDGDYACIYEDPDDSLNIYSGGATVTFNNSSVEFVNNTEDTTIIFYLDDGLIALGGIFITNGDSKNYLDGTGSPQSLWIHL